MAQLKAKLKMTYGMPWDLEHKLITEGGFTVVRRNKDEGLVVEKRHKPPVRKFDLLIDGEIPEDVQKELLGRMNNVCNSFHEPELHVAVIRRRLSNIALTLPPRQAEFVKKWMDEFVVENQ